MLCAAASSAQKFVDYSHLLAGISLNSQEQLVLNTKTNSALTEHYTFKHFYKNKEVLFSGVKVHRNDKKLQVQDYRVELTPIQFEESLPYLVQSENGLVSVKRVIESEQGGVFHNYINAKGESVFRHNTFRFIKRDTTAFTKVFKINPINTANVSYGGSYVDNGDQSNNNLNDQLEWVNLKVKYENGIYYLESDYMYFEDNSVPLDATDYEQSNDTFVFNRSDQAFEAVNTYYHINKFAEYIDSLGYNSVIKPISVDVHGFGGADNSAYNPNDHSLQFGEGGVDDAEDGEVVIHEYVHSLSETASANTTIGRQREAMEEGICDYMAKAYSRTFNDNTPNLIFSWDGHNEFWDGFEINTNRLYPQDLKNSKDGDRDMWSSVLMCIHDYIGREVTDSLVLEHLFYQKPNATMQAMADILLTIDRDDFKGRNYNPIKECLVSAGLAEYGASVDEIDKINELRFINSSGFANNAGNLRIVSDQEIERWSVTSILGEVLLSGRKDQEVILKPKMLPSGVYIVELMIDGEVFTNKIVK